MFLSRTKEAVITETPSLDVELRPSRPPMLETASSIVSVISLSTSSGAAPASVVVIVTVGASMLGN